MGGVTFKTLIKLKSLLYIFPVVLGTILSCTNRESKVTSAVDIRIHSVDVEKVSVDLSNTSAVGFSGIWNDTLYFFDGVTCYLYGIDTEGNLSGRRLGKGRGPKEIPTRNIDEVCIDPVSNEMDVLTDIHAFVYDGENSVRMYSMKYEGRDKSYSSPLAYTTWNEVILRAHDSKLYYNILGSNESVPMLDPDYYSDAAIIMCDHLKSGKMEPVGSYSEYYRDNFKKIKHLPYIFFDLDDEGNIITTFQADPNIYRYDKNHKVKEVFGCAGKGMKTNYSNPGGSERQFEKAYRDDVENAGYYYWLESEGDIVFRSYQKSGSADSDGLQIYEGSVLVGDVEVPRHFKVAGSIGDRYVTRLHIDEDTGEAYYYLFTLRQ